MNFDQSFAALIGNEGGYSTDSHDPGNWTGGEYGKGELKGTKYGISAAAFPHVNIFELTLKQAKNIYLEKYWRPFQFYQCGIPECLHFDLFDTGVNSGINTAKELLQLACGVKADGVIGPLTMAALAKMDENVLEKRFHGQRLLYITRLRQFPRYGIGWITRCANNLLID